MGEIAEDCYSQGLSDYYDMSDEDRFDSDSAWRQQAIVNERRAQRRRIEEARGTRDLFSNLDDPPF